MQGPFSLLRNLIIHLFLDVLSNIRIVDNVQCFSQSDYSICISILVEKPILTIPGHVGISTKYVAAVFEDCHGGSLSITVAVECRCSRALSLGMPAPHKSATLRALEDWV